MPLNTPEEVLVSKLLKAAAPLDAKIVIDTIANRDAIPTGDRYHMMRVDVQQDSTQYILDNPSDLTNTGWKTAFSASSGYLGLFDPNTAPTGIIKDNNDDLFSAGDWGRVSVSGFWNFTTGDQSPDGGSDHVENLLQGQSIIYNSSSIWEVEQANDLVTSVNGKQGSVVLKALDIAIDAIVGMSAAQTQDALEELKLITDGLSSGSIYLGSFDPANPPANPPTDGDTVNFSQGDFFVVGVEGIWNFPLGDQTVDGNEVNLFVGDSIRFNISDTWDVISGVSTPPGGTVEGAIQFLNASGGFGANDLLKFISGNFTLATDTQGKGIMLTDGSGNVLVTIQYAGGDGVLQVRNAAQTLVSTIAASAGVASIIAGALAVGGGQVSGIDLSLHGTGGMTVPKGTTAQRPSTPLNSMFRYNTELEQFEGYTTEWGTIGGGGTPSGTVEGAIQLRNAAGDGFDASDEFVWTTGNSSLTIRDVSLIKVVLQKNRITFNNDSNQPSAVLVGENSGQLALSANGVTEVFLFAGALASFINTGQSFGLGTNTPNSNSQLDITSTTKGFLMPKLTTAERTTLGGLLGAGDAGMKVYDTDLVQEQSWTGTEWAGIGGGASFETQAIAHSANGALNIDFDAGVFAVVTLTANITSLTFTATDGKGQVLLVQDVIGGRSVSFSGLKSIDSAIPDYSVNASAESLIDVTIANASVYVAGAGNMSVIA